MTGKTEFTHFLPGSMTLRQPGRLFNSLYWFACFAISDPINEIWFLGAAGLMCILNIAVILVRERLEDFQTVLFRISMLTGWVLLASIMIVEPTGSGFLD